MTAPDKPETAPADAGGEVVREQDVTEEWYKSLTPENRRKWLISRCRRPSQSELVLAQKKARDFGLE